MFTGSPQPVTEILLTQKLAVSPGKSFIVEMWGSSMVGEGIHPGDILIVDSLLQPRSFSIVIASFGAEIAVKVFADINTLHLVHHHAWQVLGVVTHVIHRL